MQTSLELYSPPLVLSHEEFEVKMAVQAQFQNGEVEAMQMNGVIEEDIELDEEVDSSQQVVATARKVKRIHRSSSGSESSNSNHAVEKNLSGPLQVRKNSRKSRDGKGRGLPKKGGPFYFVSSTIVKYKQIISFQASVLYSMIKHFELFWLCTTW